MNNKNATADKVKFMSKELGMDGAAIARELGITRQAVFYHLSDKSKRRRKNMPAAKRKMERATALKRYHKRKEAMEVFE